MQDRRNLASLKEQLPLYKCFSIMLLIWNLMCQIISSLASSENFVYVNMLYCCLQHSILHQLCLCWQPQDFFHVLFTNDFVFVEHQFSKCSFLFVWNVLTLKRRIDKIGQIVPKIPAEQVNIFILKTAQYLWLSHH